MYKEYRFTVNEPDKAINKRKQLKETYGYDFPLYKIDLDGKQWIGIVYPQGLQPNPKRRR